LPLGSSLVTVDEFLKKRDIEHSFDKSSKTVYATVRKLKGSTALTSESLSLKFHFDDDSKLKSIDRHEPAKRAGVVSSPKIVEARFSISFFAGELVRKCTDVEWRRR